VRITNVRVRLAEGGDGRLCGFCSITFDGEFIVRDLRIIAGEKGLFVAMPSRKATFRCHSCGQKNVYDARFCNECGAKLKPLASRRQRPSRLHADVAHPVTAACRRRIQERVLAAYHEAKKKAEEGRLSEDETTPQEENDYEMA